MKVTAVNSEGRILQIIQVTADTQNGYSTQKGVTVIGYAPPNLDHYWNGDAFIPIGEGPSVYHVFDYSMKMWVDPRSLDELKITKWNELKKQRDDIEYGGFEYNGGNYDSDLVSQNRIAVAAVASADTVWTLADNTTRRLSATQLGQLYVSLQAHISQAHERGRIAREKLFTATTVEQIDSVVF